MGTLDTALFFEWDSEMWAVYLQQRGGLFTKIRAMTLIFEHYDDIAHETLMESL